ncbi:MAG: 2-C-methyl-D-erythritol 2,4-cyclodiphosphate synthase [Acidobacteriota bacterium]
MRVGCGVDVHPLAAGRRLVLGGVEIPHERGLLGHSDADALSHAICDALLGALGLPDMGVRFPDTDESLRDRSSLLFLEEVGREVRRHGYALLNLDTTVLAESPRLQPHLPGMRERIASALGCPVEAVGIKAKRFEGVGAIGRREGVMAQAVVLLGRSPARAVAASRPGRVAARARRTARRRR